MELKMYDVGFGEFIKISQNSKQLLIVDCGSKNWNSYFPTPQNIKKPSASIINRNEIQPNSAIMISHTHTDHYNGFQYFLSNNQRFSKLYLPYVISIEDKKNPKKRFFPLEWALLDLCINGKGPRSKAYSLVGKLFTELTKLCDIGNFVFLKDGDYINEIGAHVIWPNPFSFFDTEAGLIDTILNEIAGIRENPYFLEGFSSVRETITNLFLDLIELSDLGKEKANNSGEYEKVRNRIENESIPAYTQAMQRINSGNFGRINNLNQHEAKHYANIIESNFEKSMNSCSVVMHTSGPETDTIECESACCAFAINSSPYERSSPYITQTKTCVSKEAGGTLFTGDIPQRILVRLSNKKSLKYYYHTVKIPHHGTDPYINRFLPKADYYIISNGPTNPTWGIGQSMSKYTNVKVKCTNGFKDCKCKNNAGICPKNHLCSYPIIIYGV